MSELVSLPDLPELQFDPGPHTYRLDGIIIPSVTTVLGPLNDMKYAGVGEKTLNQAANKGSAVHEAIENWVEFGIEDIEPEYRGYFEAFLKWWEEYQPVPVATERKVYHRVMRYAGTVDFLAYIADELTLIDFKTTYAMNDMTFGVQLEAYSQALKSLGIQVQRKRILQLKKDGTYEYREYPAIDSVRWRVFGGLKTIYDYIQSSK